MDWCGCELELGKWNWSKRSNSGSVSEENPAVQVKLLCSGSWGGGWPELNRRKASQGPSEA